MAAATTATRAPTVAAQNETVAVLRRVHPLVPGRAGDGAILPSQIASPVHPHPGIADGPDPVGPDRARPDPTGRVNLARLPFVSVVMKRDL